MLCWKCHSSSCSLCRPQSIPKAIRATKPLIAPFIADGAEYAALVHPSQPSIRSVPPRHVARYEPLPTTVDDRDIAEAPFFAGRLLYCRPKPPSPRRPVSYTSSVCVEQSYRSASTPSDCADSQYGGWKTPASSIHLLSE